MLSKVRFYLIDAFNRQRIGIALIKGQTAMQSREIDLRRPSTWEFSGFSQNGEDGILEVLRKRLLNSNRIFIEIGSGDGIQNNSTWLVIVERYDGLMIDGNRRFVEQTNRVVTGYSLGVQCRHQFLTVHNIDEIDYFILNNAPDVFSLDIDGNDFHIASHLFSRGFRPKIVVVEYNSALGPERSLSIEYQENFDLSRAHPSQLYYGVSLTGWKNFFEKQGYKFITVERNGVNAFFVDPSCFTDEFLAGIVSTEFLENKYQCLKFRNSHSEQFDLISKQRFVSI